jgi:hypothetical protein
MQLISIRILIATAINGSEVYRLLKKSPGVGGDLRAARVGVHLTPRPLSIWTILSEKRFSKTLAKWTIYGALTPERPFFKRETKFYLTTVHEHG